MQIHVQGYSFFNGYRHGGNTAFNVKYLNSIIEPKTKAILQEELGIEQIIIMNYSINRIPYKAKTLVNRVAMFSLREYYENKPIPKFLLLASGPSNQKSEMFSTIALLRDKNGISKSRDIVLSSPAIEAVKRHLRIDNNEIEGDMYKNIRFCPPRRKRDKKYTLYFDFTKYKDELIFPNNNLNHCPNKPVNYKAIAVAEVATDSIDANFEGSLNSIFLLVDLMEIFVINQNLGIEIMNSVLKWYLFNLRGLSEESLNSLLSERMKRKVLSLEKSDCNEVEQAELETQLKLSNDYLIILEERIKQCQDSIKREEEKIELTKKALATMKEKFANEEIDDSLCESFIEIERFNDIKEIEYDIYNKEIIIYTNMIYIYKENFKYKIGEFEIRIPYVTSLEAERFKEGESRGIDYSRIADLIKFTNLTPGYKRLSYWGIECQHPHISNRGRACFGNVASPLTECLNQGDYVGVVSLLLSFLQQANTKDPAGKQITSWDVVDDDDEVVYHGYKYDNPPEELRTVVCEKCGAEAVVSAGEVEKVMIDGKETWLCKECQARKLHYCNSCEILFSEIQQNGEINTTAKQCSICGKWFCDKHCLKEIPMDTSSSDTIKIRDYLAESEEDLCASCAYEKIKEKELLEETKKEEKRTISYSSNNSNNPFAQQIINEPLLENIPLPSINMLEPTDDDVCPECGTSWDEHYHCIICGDPMCNYNGEEGIDGCICEDCMDAMENNENEEE